jgi:muramidase (phage lysozyme)
MDRRYFADTEGKATFTPQMQDRIAVRRLEFREALHLLRAGKLEEATAAARNEWTSLPGSKENSKRHTADGKPMDMAYLASLFTTFLEAELRKFGIKGKP